MNHGTAGTRLNAEQRAIRNLMQKLGLITGDEAPSQANTCHKVLKTPLTDDMIETIR